MIKTHVTISTRFSKLLKDNVMNIFIQTSPFPLTPSTATPCTPLSKGPSPCIVNHQPSPTFLSCQSARDFPEDRDNGLRIYNILYHLFPPFMGPVCLASSPVPGNCVRTEKTSQQRTLFPGSDHLWSGTHLPLHPDPDCAPVWPLTAAAPTHLSCGCVTGRMMGSPCSACTWLCL